MAPPILAASTPIPSNAITITLKMMEITVSITAPNQAHPLPFKRPQLTKILAIPSAIRKIPNMKKDPDNLLSSFNPVAISVLLTSGNSSSSRISAISVSLT